jgi:hypothetical protein
MKKFFAECPQSEIKYLIHRQKFIFITDMFLRWLRISLILYTWICDLLMNYVHKHYTVVHQLAVSLLTSLVSFGRYRCMKIQKKKTPNFVSYCRNYSGAQTEASHEVVCGVHAETLHEAHTDVSKSKAILITDLGGL